MKTTKYSELPKEIKLQDDVNTLLDVNEELRQRINKAIEILEKEKSPCPMSLTLEKAYIIEVEKITKVLSILRGEDNE